VDSLSVSNTVNVGEHFSVTAANGALETNGSLVGSFLEVKSIITGDLSAEEGNFSSLTSDFLSVSTTLNVGDNFIVSNSALEAESVMTGALEAESVMTGDIFAETGNFSSITSDSMETEFFVTTDAASIGSLSVSNTMNIGEYFSVMAANGALESNGSLVVQTASIGMSGSKFNVNENGDVSINNNRFSVAAANGNVYISGWTLADQGLEVINGGLQLQSGAISMAGVQVLGPQVNGPAELSLNANNISQIELNANNESISVNDIRQDLLTLQDSFNSLATDVVTIQSSMNMLITALSSHGLVVPDTSAYPEEEQH